MFNDSEELHLIRPASEREYHPSARLKSSLIGMVIVRLRTLREIWSRW